MGGSVPTRWALVCFRIRVCNKPADPSGPGQPGCVLVFAEQLERGARTRGRGRPRPELALMRGRAVPAPDSVLTLAFGVEPISL